MTMALGPELSENAPGHSGKMSAPCFISTHTVNILGFNICLRKDWKTLAFIGTAYYHINLQKLKIVQIHATIEFWSLK